MKYLARTHVVRGAGLYRPVRSTRWGETGERDVWVAWHASQHASPAVEGALHFELQACTFFPAST